MKEIIEKETEKIERYGFGYKELPKLEIDEDDLIESFEDQHKRYKAIVKEIIETWSPASNNDFLLYIEVLRVLELMTVTSGKDNYVFKIKKGDLRYIPSSETITRTRRALNAKGECLPSNPKVLLRRSQRQATLRKYFGGNKE